MSLFAWLSLGVVIGYLGSLIMRSDADRGALLSVSAGIAGALIADWLLVPRLHATAAEGFFSLSAVLVSLLGAVVLVALVNLLRRGRIR